MGLDNDGGITATLDDAKQDVQVRAANDPSTWDKVHEEIKRAVGACLGVGVQGGTTWAALGENVLVQLTSWRTAVQFVVRRIGLAAAVSCLGGIVWEYV